MNTIYYQFVQIRKNNRAFLHIFVLNRSDMNINMNINRYSSQLKGMYSIKGSFKNGIIFSRNATGHSSELNSLPDKEVSCWN